MGELVISGRLEPRGPAAALVLTDEQVASLGAGRTPPVRVTIGGASVDGRVGRMGGENLLGFSKAARAALGVEPGDEVRAHLELITQPSVIELPDDLATALADRPGARATFDALAPSRRKEHVRSVTEAKKPETRARRVAAVVESVDPSSS